MAEPAFGTGPLPVLSDVDTVVAGGSLAGVAAAIELGRAGRRVLVVEPGTYLGHEITATLRYWCPAPGLPDLLRPGIPDGAVPGGEIALWPDGLKRGLEDALAAAGVGLLYAATPVGLHPSTGIALATKAGRRLVGCHSVIDATGTGLVARLAGDPPATGDTTGRYRGVVEFDGVRPGAGAGAPPGTDTGVPPGAVALHRGYRGEGHVLVEYAFTAPTAADLAGEQRRLAAMRAAGRRLAERLLTTDPRFAGAWPAALAARPYGPVPPTPPRDAELPPGVGQASFAGPEPGMWRLPLGTDPVTSIHRGARLGAAVARSTDRLPTGADRVGPDQPTHDAYRGDPERLDHGTRRGSLDRLADGAVVVAEHRGGVLDRGGRWAGVPAQPVPVAAEVDVLVVGGGSSGAAAAIAAARAGARTLVVDLNPGLGGTGTYGGVDSYWFGRRAGFAAEVGRRVRQAHRRLGLTRRRGRWNTELKAAVLEEMAGAAGVRLWTGVTATAALVRGGTVAGAVLATGYGPVAVRAGVVVDATGDADVAALAGAGIRYGSGAGTVMWYSLAQLDEPGRSRNNFGGAADVSDVEDYTRAVLAGRRRGGRLHDHGGYLATRESRHVVGEVTVTLTDQLTGRRWPDVVNVHYGNHDIKGPSASRWPLAGLVPPNLHVGMPYRALLPRGLDGILVVGKAISATHDGLAAVRMQADLENLGAVAGLAAASAAASGTTPRALDVAALQRRLVRAGILPAAAIDRESEPATAWEPDALADAVAASAPLSRYNEMGRRAVHRGAIPFVVAVLRDDEDSAAALRRALRRHTGPARTVLAQALALRGEAAGVDVLLDELDAMLAGDTLPRQSSAVRNAQLAPDHAAMPDAAHLLYTLAFAGTPRAVPRWHRVAELAEPTYAAMWDSAAGLYAYVDAVSTGATRLADPAAVPALRRLHAADCLHDQHRPAVEPDIVRERLAMLELGLGRALAACGAPDGTEILLNYLSDARTLLVRQAHDALRARWRTDLPADPTAWRAVTGRLSAAR